MVVLTPVMSIEHVIQIRLIHGSSAMVPYHETALQNLFVQSYKRAGIDSRIKVHLARHMLGYHQEKMGCVPFQKLIPLLLIHDTGSTSNKHQS
jgi:hypothetical protein